MDDMAGRLTPSSPPPQKAGQSLVSRIVFHVACLLPLLAAAAAIALDALSAPGPALVIAAFIAYGRLAAFASGSRGAEEAIFMLECLPFAAFASAQGCSLPPVAALILTASMAAAASGLASLEDLLLPSYRGFALALAFCALIVGMALALTGLEGKFAAGGWGPEAGLAGAGLLLTLATRYVASRRKR